MRAPLCLREAFLSALRRPVRSILVLQAIIWGSAAVIFPQAIYQGSREAAFSRAGELAADRIIIASPEGPVLESWDEVPAFAEGLPSCEAITGIARTRVGAIDILGTDRGSLDARRLALAAGRNFAPEEIAAGSPVCILEAGIAAELFPAEDPIEKSDPVEKGHPIGKDVRLDDGRALRVVGVLEPRPPSTLRTDQLGYDRSHVLGFLVRSIFSHMGVDPAGMEWLNSERNVIVPWRLIGEAPRWVLLRTDPHRVPAATEEIQRRFARRGKEVAVYSNVLLTLLLAPEIERLISVANDLFLLSLFMGMAVVANVMLMTVNERKAEIAIRRCEGARTVDIAAQFILETGAFSATGAAVGMPLGILLAWARASLDPATLTSWTVPWTHVGITLACVVGGGFLAGLPPAIRAARLDPVEVLSRA